MLEYRRLLAGRTSFEPDPDTRGLTMCALLLIVACEYKFRVRDVDKAVSGDPDLFVLLEIATYAAVACWLFLRFRPAPRLVTAHWTVLAAYAYSAVLALSALYSPYFEMALVRAWQVAIILALTRSIARHATRGSMHHLAHWYTVLVAGSVLFGALVPFSRSESRSERFTWLYVHPVVAGQFLAIAVPILLVYLVGRRASRPGPCWPPGVYLVLLAVCAGGLVATNTRGATAAALVGGATVLWIRWRGTRRLEVAAVAAVALLAFVLATYSAIMAFFTRGHSAARLATLNSRTELWGYAFEAFFQHPLYGYGLSATRGLFLDEIGLGGAHNAVVNLLVNNGILGVLVWAVLVGGILLVTARAGNRRPEPRMDRTLIFAVLAAMLTDSVFTEAMGAPSNVACIWLFVLAAWSGMLGTARTQDPATPNVTREAAR